MPAFPSERAMLLPVALAIAGHAAVAPSAAAADFAESWKVQNSRPLAVAGETLLLPLSPAKFADELPVRAEALLDDGDRISARLIRVTSRLDEHIRPRRWTDVAMPVRIVTVTTESIRPSDTDAFHLLIDVPEGYRGSLRIENLRIQPLWLDPAPPPTLDESSVGELNLAASNDRPDPEDPFEYWRWALLADRHGLRVADPPPDPSGDTASAEIARHGAHIWRAALARLAIASPGAATQCLRRLTATGTSDGAPIALWPTEARALDTLLLQLARPDRRPGDLIDPALEWVESVDPPPPLLLNSHERDVFLAITNLHPAGRAAQLAWDIPGEIPLAYELPPMSLVVIDHPAAPDRREPIAMPGGWVEEMPSLRVALPPAASTLIPPPRTFWAVPPGFSLGDFRPVLTLADLNSGVQPTIPPERRTTALLRSSLGRWEIYVDARRSPATQASSGEYVELHLGPYGDPSVIIRVPETGEPQIMAGTTEPQLETHRRSFADHWRLRLVLPPSWLPPTPVDPLLIGLLRSHGDSGEIESARAPMLPWRLDPPRLSVRLECWDGSKPMHP